MSSKCRRDHLKKAREAFVASFRKQKSKTSPLFIPIQHSGIDDSNQNTTSNTEHESGIWFWNESVNETNLDSEEENNDGVESFDTDKGDRDKDDADKGNADKSNAGKDDLRKRKIDKNINPPRTERAISPQIQMMNLRWNKEGEKKFRGGYKNGSRLSRKRQKKSDQEREKEAAKLYNIEALWQRKHDLDLISSVSNPGNNQEELDSPGQSLPIDTVSSVRLLSEVPQGLGTSTLSPQQVFKNHRVERLKDLTKLFESIKEQEKKYGDKLSPHGNFYR